MPMLSAAEKPARGSNNGVKKRTNVGKDAVLASEALRAASTVAVGGDALSIPAVSAALRSITERTPDAESRVKMEGALRALRDDIQKLTGTLGKKKLSQRYVEGVDKRAKPTKEERSTVIEIGEKPLGISVVGSFLLNLWRDHADIAVRVPEGYFGDRDVGNFKYHRKRVLLLAHIRKHLDSLGWESSFQGTDYKPVLCVTKRKEDNAGEEGPSLRVHLLWCDVFPPRYLAPGRRNVHEHGESAVVDDTRLATPAYNASIAIDGAYMKHLRLSHAAEKAAPAFASAARLLAAWCIRRRLLFGGSSFVPTVLLADSLVNHGAPCTANASHLFRFALTLISTGALENLECGGVRVCGLFDNGILQRAKLEAKAALVILDSPSAVVDPWKGALSGLFHTARGGMNESVPLTTLFDAFVHVKAETAAGKAHLKSPGKVASILRDALMMTQRAASVEEVADGLFGIELLKTTDTVRRVDLCPDDVTEEKFREFWGEKVELRRFNDGNIKLSLIWDGGPDTLETITKFAFEKHLGDDLSVNFVFQVEEAAGISRGNEAEVMRMHAALHELGKTMRALEDLPLRVTSVTGASAHLRRAAVQNARPRSKGQFIEPIECIAEFESSKSWPKDAVAISASKAGFYVALQGALKKDKGMETQATISYVDVFLSGFVFRIRIHIEAEKDCFREDSSDRAELLWQTKGRFRVHNELRMVPLAETSAAVSRVVKRWLSAHMLFAYMGDRREELVELLVARALEGPSARPVKSVLCGFAQVLHLISEYPWETSPLMVSSSTKKDFNMDDEEEDATTINSLEDRRNEVRTSEAFRKFENLKKHKGKGPSLGVIFDDGEPFRWFERSNTPENEIFLRLVATANASLQHLENVAQGKVGPEGLKTLFRTPIEGVFQLALEIRPEAAPRAGKLKGRNKPVRKLANSLVGFNPIERLRAKLAEELGDMALFLHDTFAGDVIYVVWKKNALKKEKPFMIKNMRFSIPDAEKNVLVPDRRGILEEILRLGNGMITNVRHLMEDEAF